MIIDDLRNYRTEELQFEIERRKEEKVNKPEIWINQQTADKILAWARKHGTGIKGTEGYSPFPGCKCAFHRFGDFLNSLVSKDDTKKICQFVAGSIVNSGKGIGTGTDICIPQWAIQMAFKAGNSLEDRNNG